jgi:DNA-binding transcriptional ArsR family regulator
MSDGLDQTFSALADPARLAVIGLLRREPLRSSEIARRLSLSRPQMSKHLQVLRKAGLIEERGDAEDARARIYQLRGAPFSELRSWLDDVEAFWADQLQAFKQHAERRARNKPGKSG